MYGCGCVYEVIAQLYSVICYIYTLWVLVLCFHYGCAVYGMCKWLGTLWPADYFPSSGRISREAEIILLIRNVDIDSGISCHCLHMQSEKHISFAFLRGGLQRSHTPQNYKTTLIVMRGLMSLFLWDPGLKNPCEKRGWMCVLCSIEFS